MYRNGDGVAVNMKKAIHHFETLAIYERDDAHWHLGRIYKTKGNRNKSTIYHFRCAADLGHQKARTRVGEYFVRVTGPRKLSFTNDELLVFLRKMKSQYSRRRNNTEHILASTGQTHSTAFGDCVRDLIDNISQRKPPVGSSASHSLAIPPTNNDIAELMELKDMVLDRTSISK